jgi:iron complex transport system ATP-binding protein
VNARLLDADWRCACGELPAGERPLWLDDDDDDPVDDAPTLDDGQGLCALDVGVRAGASTLLQGVQLRLAPGEVGAILGPNGAGKSTLLSVLSGLRAPDTGRVTLNGLAVTPATVHLLARHRAVLPQETAVAFDFRVQDVVELGRYPHHLQPSTNEAAIVRAAMRATGVADMADRSWRG